MRNFDNIKYERKQRTYVNHMELELIRNACRTPRETFIVEFLFSTGCRVHEFVNVRLDDIDLVNQTVHLFGKGKKHRTSFLNAKAIVAYKKYMDTRIDHTNYLIVDVKNKENPNCASTKSIRECLHNIISRTDIEKNVTPHVMRHTTASLALQAGMDMDIVSKLLGHASISTTQIYAERDESDMQTAHKKYLS